ncbi:hypothetical protein VPH35_040393 [Triticum aestivum]
MASVAAVEGASRARHCCSALPLSDPTRHPPPHLRHRPCPPPPAAWPGTERRRSGRAAAVATNAAALPLPRTPRCGTRIRGPCFLPDGNGSLPCRGNGMLIGWWRHV